MEYSEVLSGKMNHVTHRILILVHVWKEMRVFDIEAAVVNAFSMIRKILE